MFNNSWFRISIDLCEQEHNIISLKIIVYIIKIVSVIADYNYSSVKLFKPNVYLVAIN